MNQVANRIEWLEQQIAHASDLQTSSASPKSPAALLESRSWQTHIEELQQDLRQAKEALARELVELRLVGGAVNNGSVPLRLAGKVVETLNSAISSAAHYLRFGEDARRGIDAGLQDELDLRLSGLAFGSSRILISGNIAPDTTGESILDMALHHIFQILVAESIEDMREELSSIGPRSVREVTELLRILEGDQIGAGLAWLAPNSNEYRWGGSLSMVKETRARLARVATRAPEVIVATGEITSLSQSGSFYVKFHGEDRKTKIKYPTKLYELVASFHLGQHVALRLNKYTHIDEVTGQERSSYTMLGQSAN